MRKRILWMAVSALLLAACGPARAFPELPGWQVSQPARSFDRDNLFELVNGQAESFFAFGFERVTVQRYANSDGTNLNIEIWQLATPADAFGLYAAGRSGQPVAVGNEGESDPGRRLSFWQERYFVALNADQPVPDETLLACAQAIAAALPSGGSVPAILARLPRTGLDERNVFFFHEEISVQTQVWLGGENLLGLGQETDGVVGYYSMDGVGMHLVLIEYPDEGRAADGLAVLERGDIDQVVAAGRNGRLVGAVIGPVDEAPARALLQEALK